MHQQRCMTSTHTQNRELNTDYEKHRTASTSTLASSGTQIGPTALGRITSSVVSWGRCSLCPPKASQTPVHGVLRVHDSSINPASGTPQDKHDNRIHCKPKNLPGTPPLAKGKVLTSTRDHNMKALPFNLICSRWTLTKTPD